MISEVYFLSRNTKRSLLRFGTFNVDQSKGPHSSGVIGHGSQQSREALPCSWSERCECCHSEGHPALLLVLAVLQEPCDWSEIRRCHTQEQKVADGEREQKCRFRKPS